MSFELLSSTEEEILETFLQKPEAEGFQRFKNRYATEKNFGRPYPSTQICQYLDKLVAENYISKYRKAGGEMLTISLLPRGRNYFEMKERQAKSQEFSTNIIQTNNHYGNGPFVASIGDNNVNATISFDKAEKIRNVIGDMRNALAGCQLDEKTKGDISDELDNIQKEVEAPATNGSKLSRALQRLADAIRNTAAATGLLVHLNTLTPLVNEVVSNLVQRC